MEKNRLETVPIPTLLKEFAIPSIIAMLVSSLYNIVDQIFIGQTVGTLGNAATNIQYPLSIAATAFALLFGVGGASSFNLSIGKSKFEPEEKENAAHYMGTAVTSILVIGVILTLLTQLFLYPLLQAFGSPEEVLPYAATYTRIVAFGFPFLMLATAGGHLLRADGRPTTMMLSNLTVLLSTSS